MTDIIANVQQEMTLRKHQQSLLPNQRDQYVCLKTVHSQHEVYQLISQEHLDKCKAFEAGRLSPIFNPFDGRQYHEYHSENDWNEPCCWSEMSPH